MPRLCLLDGIVIWINTRDHAPPHFHARYGGDEVRVDLLTVTVISGRLSASKERLLLKWAAVRQPERVTNWELARKGLPHEPIAPTLELQEDPDGA